MRAWSPLESLLKTWRAAHRLRLQSSSSWTPRVGLCSDREEGAQRNVKEHLRFLFKLIHPDLFHGQPLEQTVNQNSFQLLQEYLNAAKAGGSDRQLPYHFVFFIRQDAAAENLKKVEVSLPPPQASYLAQKNSDELPPSTRWALSRLFTLCGLSGFDSYVPATDEEQIRLSVLFQQASEILRKNEASAVDYERRLAGTKNALRLGRGIKVAFRPPVSDMSGNDQVKMMEKLAIALDRAQDVKLSGHNLLIGDCYGVDALGNIWLRYEDDHLEWSHFLNNLDIEKAVKNRKEGTNRRVLEFKAARAMEVEMIFTHDRLAIQPEYMCFLNTTIKDALVHGAVGDGKFCKLPVRITCPDRELSSDNVNGSQRHEASYMKVDETFGYVAVPVWESLPNIYKFIEQRGNEALEIRERLSFSEKHIDQVKHLVRKKLRLRELIFDRKLGSNLCLLACTRLIQYAPELEMFTEGLALCISDEHRLPIEGAKSYLHLKWNFSLSEL